jgi:hypothetical protein
VAKGGGHNFENNMKTDTPRTDNEVDHACNVALQWECRDIGTMTDQPMVVGAEFARELERELAKATAQRSMLAVDMSVILTIATEPLHPRCLEAIQGICKQTLKTINQENQ